MKFWSQVATFSVVLSPIIFEISRAAIGQLLKDLKFPADKNKIIQFVQLQETPTNISKEDILYTTKEY